MKIVAATLFATVIAFSPAQSQSFDAERYARMAECASSFIAAGELARSSALLFGPPIAGPLREFYTTVYGIVTDMVRTVQSEEKNNKFLDTVSSMAEVKGKRVYPAFGDQSELRAEIASCFKEFPPKP